MPNRSKGKKPAHDSNPEAKAGAGASTSAAQEEIASEDREELIQWLQTGDGFESMKLFVVINSIVVFGVMAWPNMKQTLLIIYDYFVGTGEETTALEF